MNSAQMQALQFWERVSDVGTLLVIIGVVGEGVEIVLKILEHRLANRRFLSWCEKRRFLIEIWGAMFWLMVVVGLAVEFQGNHRVKIISAKENAEMNMEAADSRLKASQLALELEKVRNVANKNAPENFPISSVDGFGFVIVNAGDAAAVSGLTNAKVRIALLPDKEFIGMGGIFVDGQILSLHTNIDGDCVMHMNFEGSGLMTVGPIPPPTFNNLSAVRLSLFPTDAQYAAAKIRTKRGYLSLDINPAFRFRVEIKFPEQTNNLWGIIGFRDRT